MYINRLKTIKFEKDKFVDLSEYHTEYENILNFFVLNVLIYMFSVIDIISKTSKQFNYIAKSLCEVYTLFFT